MLYSPDHRAVVYETATPLRIAAVTRRAVKLPTGVAVPASLPNLQALAALGEVVPSPMTVEGYDWPIREPFKPLLHQQITAAFLAVNPRSFCLNDMGTMKTLSTLWAADFLMAMHKRVGLPFRALIVAPLSTLEPVWLKAITQHFLGRRKAAVLHGSAEKRRKLLERDVDFYIINPDGLCIGVPDNRRSPLEGLAKDFYARTDIGLVIADEASVYRDASTRRHKAARTLIGDKPYLWLLSGTPTPNGPVDAYGLAKLMKTHDGETFTNYKARVMVQVAPYKWLPKAGSARAVTALLSPAIRYSIEECVELPKCVSQRRTVELSAEQKVALKKLKHDAVLAMNDGSLVHAVNEAALRMKLIQVLAGEVYDSDHQSHNLNPHGRLSLVEELLEQTDRKVVVFAPLTNVLNMLSRHFDKTPHAVLNGETKQPDRVRILREFGDPKHATRLLFADPGTISHGVNDLVTANILVWYAPTDKNELYQQGIKRIDRPGQTSASIVVQIVSNPLEDEIYDRLESNQSMQGLILKLAKGLQ